ncbi:MAG: hypothetical protein EBQ92_10710 [Proteobacteria bacterium]|nr:hypothetical protein [Pseudomonadota bacterium]
MFLNCPKPEEFLQLVSVPEELSLISRFFLRTHLGICSSCRTSLEATQVAWTNFLKPEPEITSSLLKVYSRLQNDETLILKGWKLGSQRRQRELRSLLFNEGWLFRGGVFLGLGILVGVVAFSTLGQKPLEKGNFPLGPLAQIRQQEKNKVKVHYLQPELLHTIEFETTRSAR